MLNLNLNTTARLFGGAITPPVPGPTADFTASTVTPATGASVNFTDTSEGTPTAWSWTFEGGTPSGSTGQNPSVSWGSTGCFDVSLTASNINGSNTCTKTDYICVQAVIPPVETLFTSNGTWSCCPGAVCVEVIAVGAGGGGGDGSAATITNGETNTGGGGGGAAGVTICTLTSGFGTSQSIVIGTSARATNGGASCFGSLVIANGGNAGNNGSKFATTGTTDGGNGGVGITCTGGKGGNSVAIASNNSGCPGAAYAAGGGGAISWRNGNNYPFSSGGAGASSISVCGLTIGPGGDGGNCRTNGSSGSNYGAGGGGGGAGANQTGAAGIGAAGSNGVIKVIQYF